MRQLARRREMPTINKLMGIGSFGFTAAFPDLATNGAGASCTIQSRRRRRRRAGRRCGSAGMPTPISISMPGYESVKFSGRRTDHDHDVGKDFADRLS